MPTCPRCRNVGNTVWVLATYRPVGDHRGAGGGGAGRSVVPWNKPLTVTAQDGTITSVTATGPDGTPLPGTVTAAGWTSTMTLTPVS